MSEHDIRALDALDEAAERAGGSMPFSLPTARKKA